MIINRIEGGRLLKFWLLAASAFASYWLWYLVLFSFYGASYPSPARYALYSIVIISAIVLERLARSHFQTIAPAYQSADRTVYITVRQVLSAAVAVMIVAFITKDKTISRAFFLSYFLVLPAFLLIVNQWIIPRLTRKMFQGNRRLTAVLIGEPDEIRRHCEWFRFEEGLGLNVIGYIGNGPDSPTIDGLPHLGPISDLESCLETSRPATAIFLDPPGACQNFAEHKALGDHLGIRTVHVWDFQTHFGFVPTIHTEAGLQFLSFLSEPLESPANRALKRVFDVGIALPVCLFILPPLILFVLIAQRLQSPGKLFFVQERRGQGGQLFRMLKFRTMHPENPDETRQAHRGDTRIFSIGGFLRRTSMDEMPQFLNVLLGEMSVVGPRPHLSAHDERFATSFHGYNIRSFVKPGITGLAQVRGHRGLIETDEDISERARADLQYLENWSIFLDTSIVLRTIHTVVRPSSSAN